MMRTPVTVLTRFPGAGKTTLLERVLRERHGRRHEVVELNNGCLRCKVRGDLIRVVSGLMRRRIFHGVHRRIDTGFDCPCACKADS